MVANFTSSQVSPRSSLATGRGFADSRCRVCVCGHDRKSCRGTVYGSLIYLSLFVANPKKSLHLSLSPSQVFYGRICSFRHSPAQCSPPLVAAAPSPTQTCSAISKCSNWRQHICRSTRSLGENFHHLLESPCWLEPFPSSASLYYRINERESQFRLCGHYG